MREKEGTERDGKEGKGKEEEWRMQKIHIKQNEKKGQKESCIKMGGNSSV